MIWDERVISEKCLVCLGFRNNDNSKWWLMGVYGSNSPKLRGSFWELSSLFRL